ncbi:MAG: hypothetical protein AAGL10_10660 [Pseudomonadota bacterium]
MSLSLHTGSGSQIARQRPNSMYAIMRRSQFTCWELVCSAAAIAASCLAPQAAVAQYLDCERPLFATDLDGNPTHGSKDALVSAVNKGRSIRIGWGLDFDGDGQSELTHWADAQFLSVWEGEVFAQVAAIHTQRPRRGKADITLSDPFVEWRGSIGTTGKLEGRSSDGKVFPAAVAIETMWCAALPGPQGWVLLYRNGTRGEDLAGSKDALLAAIRSGQPIQIGWAFSRSGGDETYSAEHLAAPVFVTITNGSEVTAQLPVQYGQWSYLAVDAALSDRPDVMWRGLMATTGAFDVVWVNGPSGETIRRYPQRAVLNWYAPVSPDLSSEALAHPSGVIPDSAGREVRAPQRFSDSLNE